jgi:hypothetical protein
VSISRGVRASSFGAQTGGDRQALVGVTGRHPDVGDDHIGRMLFDEREAAGQVGGRTDELQIGC